MSKNYKKSFSWHFPAYGWVRHLICNNVIHLMHRDFILTFWACLNFYVDQMKIYLIIHSILESLHKSLEPQASTNQYDWQPIKKFKKYICIIQLKLNELCISIFKHMLERVFTFNSAKFLFLIPNQANCHDRYVIFQFITCNN